MYSKRCNGKVRDSFPKDATENRLAVFLASLENSKSFPEEMKG